MHARTCFVLSPENPKMSGTYVCTGKEEGSVGAASPPAGGRGEDLLSCGDVESNPGPEGPGERDPGDGMQLDGALPREPNGVGPGPIRTRTRVQNRGMVVHQVETLMATSTDAIGNLEHPALLQESMDLAHQDVRSGPPIAAPPWGGSFGRPKKATGVPCDMQSLLRSRIFTVKHVPAGSQAKVSAALAGIIAAYCADPCEAHLFGMMAFPKLVLRTAPAKGSRGPEHLRTVLEHRLQLFCDGGYQTLWDHALRDNCNALNFNAATARAVKRQRTGGGEQVSDRTLDRVRELVAEGASKKALQLLTSTGIHDSSDPLVIQQLRKLHPPQEGELPLYAPGEATVWEARSAETFWGPLVRESILHFSQSQGAGSVGSAPEPLARCREAAGSRKCAGHRLGIPGGVVDTGSAA